MWAAAASAADMCQISYTIELSSRASWRAPPGMAKARYNKSARNPLRWPRPHYPGAPAIRQNDQLFDNPGSIHMKEPSA
jgi:hypothetical protein